MWLPAQAVRVTRLLSILLALDAVLIGLHVLVQNGSLSNVRFEITREAGFAELFQYAKEAACAILLWDIFRRSRSATAFVWAAGFAGLLVDDALAIHEYLGTFLGPRQMPHGFAGLRPNHAFELWVLGFGVLGFLAVVIAATAREGEVALRITCTLAGLLIALAFFGVVVDALHAVASGSAWRRAFAILEDGGEMVVASALVSATWTLRRHVRASLSTCAASSGAVGFR